MAVHHLVRARTYKLLRVTIMTVSTTDKSPDGHPGSKAGQNTIGTVLNHQTVCRCNTQFFSREHKQVRCRFAIGHLFAGVDMRRKIVVKSCVLKLMDQTVEARR
mgnify:CR=1 FL=1